MDKIRLKLYTKILVLHLIYFVLYTTCMLCSGASHWYQWIVLFLPTYALLNGVILKSTYVFMYYINHYNKKDWDYLIKKQYNLLRTSYEDGGLLMLAVAYFNTNQDELFLAQLTKFPGRPKDYLYCESAKAFYTYLYALVNGKDNVEYCYKRYTWIPDKDEDMEKQALLIYDLTHNFYSRKQLCEILPQVENDRVREFLKSTYSKKN